MEDKEKTENKVDLKRKREKSFNTKIIITQVIIILIFMVEVVMIVYLINELNTETSGGGTQEISTFNSMWEAYVGTHCTAAQVNTMCSAIYASNSSEQKNGRERYVGIYFDPSLGVEIEENTEINVEYGVAVTKATNITSDRTYTVTAIYGEKGYIIGMKVEQ